jgi:hypothetical protein
VTWDGSWARHFDIAKNKSDGTAKLSIIEISDLGFLRTFAGQQALIHSKTPDGGQVAIVDGLRQFDGKVRSLTPALIRTVAVGTSPTFSGLFPVRLFALQWKACFDYCHRRPFGVQVISI